MRRIIVCLIVCVILTGCGMLEDVYKSQIGTNVDEVGNRAEDTTEPDCVSSIHSDADYKLTIIANREEITDKEEFAKELIEKARNNGFKTIMFSYDLSGYPTSLDMKVYLTQEDWQDRDTEPIMKISVQQEDWGNGYNIVEHLDKFEIVID